MSSGARELTINSSVFSWLFHTSGYPETEIIEKTNISPDRWHSFLDSEDTITLPLHTIKSLAEIYNRPITAFLIPFPPKDNPVPKDFRRAPKSLHYSRELHKTFIKAQRNLRLFVEMTENMDGEFTYPHACYTINDDPFVAAEKEREHLNVEDAPQNKLTESEAWKEWRELIIDTNIPVFQYNLDSDGLGGFVTKWHEKYGIVINSSDLYKVRIFTLFHEYAHILLGTDPVCSDDGTTSSNAEIDRIEQWCDNFSGAFLMPMHVIRNSEKITRYLEKNEYIKAAKELASLTTASRSAALIRLRVCGLIPANAGAKELAEWKAKALENKQKKENKNKDEKSKIIIKPYDKKVGELGQGYLALAEKNYSTGKISYATYLENIGLNKVTHERLHQEGVM